MKTLIVLLVLIAAFFIVPRFISHAPAIVKNVEEEIIKTVPLILQRDAPTSHLTVDGVFSETNRARTSESTSKRLILSAELSRVAQLRAEDMFAKQYFEHYSPEGIGAADVAKQVGYEYLLIGENIALGNFKDDRALVDAWMNSPGHRANILRDKFSKIGVAVVRGTFKGKKTWIAVQIFSRPAAECPVTDTSLHDRIDIDQTRVTALKVQLEEEKQHLTSSSEVAVYNTHVQEVNSLIEKIKVNIATYNKEVNAFNTCLNS